MNKVVTINKQVVLAFFLISVIVFSVSQKQQSIITMEEQELSNNSQLINSLFPPSFKAKATDYNYLEIGQWDDNYGEAIDVFISNNRAYVINYCEGLTILDVSTPSSPKLLSNFKVLGLLSEVFVMNEYAYIGTGFGLIILDVSDPTNPIKSGEVLFGSVYGLFVVDNYAYVASDVNGLGIINVSNPTTPQIIAQFQEDTFPSWDVFVLDNYAYLTSIRKGLEVINISNPTTPQKVGEIDDG